MANGQSQSDVSSGSWLSSAAPLIGAGLDFVSGLGSSLFNLNQAKKNRAFQERMYNRQVADNIRFWKMQNDYNLPSAQLQRLEDAGLNPLMMYEGGSAVIPANSIQSGNAPSGDSARAAMPTNFTSAATEAALIRAQTRKLNAESENLEQNTDESWTRTDWYRSVKGIQYAILKKNDSLLWYQIHNIATSTNALADMTFKNLELMDKAIDMMDKNYDLSARDLENRILYNAAQIALGEKQVDATLRQIGVNMYEAVTHRKLAIAEIEKFAAEIKKIVADTSVSEAERLVKLNQVVEGKIGNILYGTTGAKQLSGNVAATLLITGNLFGRDDEALKEIKSMYKSLGIDF